MTKPTGVREIIEGIEDEAHTFDGGDCEHMIDMYSYQKVVAIALELERQRDLLLLGKPMFTKERWKNDLLKIAKGEA